MNNKVRRTVSLNKNVDEELHKLVVEKQQKGEIGWNVSSYVNQVLAKALGIFKK